MYAVEVYSAVSTHSLTLNIADMPSAPVPWAIPDRYEGQSPILALISSTYYVCVNVLFMRRCLGKLSFMATHHKHHSYTLSIYTYAPKTYPNKTVAWHIPTPKALKCTHCYSTLPYTVQNSCTILSLNHIQTHAHTQSKGLSCMLPLLDVDTPVSIS